MGGVCVDMSEFGTALLTSDVDMYDALGRKIEPPPADANAERQVSIFVGIRDKKPDDEDERILSRVCMDHGARPASVLARRRRARANRSNARVAGGRGEPLWIGGGKQSAGWAWVPVSKAKACALAIKAKGSYKIA